MGPLVSQMRAGEFEMLTGARVAFVVIWSIGEARILAGNLQPVMPTGNSFKKSFEIRALLYAVR